MLSKIMTKMYHHFPDILQNIQEFYIRLFLMIFTLSGVLIIAFVNPWKRMLAIEALHFQFFGAALLWWEANAEASITIVVNEFRLQGTPETRAGRNFIGVGVMLVVYLLLLTLLAATSPAPHLYAIAILLGIFFAISLGVWLLKKRTDKVIRSIREADARSNIEEARQATRRALRTIGFALVAGGTLLQTYPTWVG